MELSKYVACICEGSAEAAIIDLLLDNDMLIFSRQDMLEEKVIRTRSGADFERKYLRKGFDGKITAVRILDSHNENFRLSKAYRDKVDVVNVVTAPEIEMLVILAEGRYTEFKSSDMKPSDYCVTSLRYSDVKSREWVRNYFGDIEKLLSAIKEYKRITKRRRNEYFLFDLIKSGAMQ